MLPIITLGNIHLPSYFLVISLAFCFATLYFLKEIRETELSPLIALDLSLVLMVGSFIGARLFHVFYEEPVYYLNRPLDFFKIWQGGFVFYGGVLGASLLGILYLRYKKQNLLKWLDPFAMIFAPTYALGRFATLLSGSGYGKPTNLPWGITYPLGSEAPAYIRLHPTPLYAILLALMIWGTLLYLKKKRPFLSSLQKEGQLFIVLGICYSIYRLIIEQFRADPRGYTLFSLSISSWISLIILASFTFIFIYRSKRIS